jgi:hypothetical protein
LAVERVFVSRLRPWPPAGPRDGVLATAVTLADAYPIGTAVDVRTKDLWWEGVVVREGDGKRQHGSIVVLHPGA